MLLTFADIDGKNRIAWLAIAPRLTLAQRIDDIHSSDDAAKDAMLAIEVRRGTKGDEELRAVSTRPRLCCFQQCDRVLATLLFG